MTLEYLLVAWKHREGWAIAGLVYNSIGFCFGVIIVSVAGVFFFVNEVVTEVYYGDFPL